MNEIEKIIEFVGEHKKLPALLKSSIEFLTVVKNDLCNAITAEDAIGVQTTIQGWRGRLTNIEESFEPFQRMKNNLMAEIKDDITPDAVQAIEKS